MRILLSLPLACFLLEFCSAAPPAKIWVTDRSYHDTVGRITQQTFTVAEMTYDQVWNACDRALVRSGYEFYVSNKTSGEIRVRSIINAKFAGRFEPSSEFLIRVAKDSGKISVTVCCTYSREGDRSAIEGQKESETDRVIGVIKKELKK